MFFALIAVIKFMKTLLVHNSKNGSSRTMRRKRCSLISLSKKNTDSVLTAGCIVRRSMDASLYIVLPHYARTLSTFVIFADLRQLKPNTLLILLMIRTETTAWVQKTNQLSMCHSKWYHKKYLMLKKTYLKMNRDTDLISQKKIGVTNKLLKI